MERMKRMTLSVIALLMICACQAGKVDKAETTEAVAAPSATEIPMTTASEEAKARMREGLEAGDLGRGEEAREAFAAAVAADPEFAMGYLQKSWWATSYSEFVENLNKAVEYASSASEPEQALIASTKKAFENDLDGMLAESKRVAELVPDSPRAWLRVANSYSARGDYAEERSTVGKIIAMAPDFAPAYAVAANSYLFNEPRDFSKAESYVEKLLELTPEEQNSHDLMGDVHRAQGDLQAALEDYTRAAELAPENGSPLQQRGHVNSFLGNYDGARADYDAAMELVEPQVAANFGIFRALVSVHEGDPEAAVSEFEERISAIDGMSLDDPYTPKIQYLGNITMIAAHNGMFDVAEEAIERAHELRMQRLEATGAEEDRGDQEATVSLQQGMVAALQGDVEMAKAKVEEYRMLVADNADPRKEEPAEAILGLAALQADDYFSAIEHFEKADPGNPYIKYHLGLAYESSGNAERASEIFADLAVYNFNGVGYALIRADALAKAAT
jgi:tetratricopeptide (TPR) repeat protein